MIAAGSASIDVPAWTAAIIALITAAGLIAAAVAVTRKAAIEASLTAIVTVNGELRKGLEDVRVEMAADRARHAKELGEEREKRAHLEGQVAALTSGLAKQIVDAVRDSLGDTTTTTTTRTPKG